MENISESVRAAHVNALKTFTQNVLFFEFTWVLFMTVFSAIGGHNARPSIAQKYCIIIVNQHLNDFAINQQNIVLEITISREIYLPTNSVCEAENQ